MEWKRSSVVASFFLAYCEGREENSKVFTCLVAGYDEAAENTDVLFVFTYKERENEVSFLQIPRDSFSEYNGTYGKINRIYSSLRGEGKTPSESLDELSLFAEELLGIELDASISLSLGALSRLVDEVGGVYINIPEHVRLDDMPIKLSYGENLISGNDALKLVRERNKYPSGDLSRLDSQKIFLEGVFHTLFERLDAKKLVKLIFTRDDEVEVNASLFEISALIVKDFNDIKNSSLAFLTLPGEACEYKGVSYYVVNKKAANDALARYFYLGGERFDEENKLTDAENPIVNEIYGRKSFKYKVYVSGKYLDIKVD